MAHAEKRASPLREGAIGIATGALYGTVHTISGHPLDNIKAAMQLEKSMHGLSPFAATRAMFKRDGIVAFWRGCVPPLWGSAVYRSLMMSSYELSFTYFEKTLPASSPMKQEYLGCVRPMVVASSVFCSLCRVLVEAPVEQAKVSRQLNRPIEWSNLYRGVVVQTARTTMMLLCIFVPFDVARRKTELLRTKWGNFAVVFSACGFAYAAAWPLETLKNCAQAGLPKPGASIAERIKYLGGPRGLYLGVAPGILCGAFRNGCAAVAMNGLANPLLTRLGLRRETGK